jgi:hypothetical protein
MNIPYTKGARMLDDRESGSPGLPRLHTGPMRIVGQKNGEKEKKAWDARQWLRDHAPGAYRAGRGAPREPKKEGGGGGGGMTTITVQAIICGFVIVAVLIMKSLNIPQTQEVLAGLDNALTTGTDMDKALGKLKFVSDIFGSGSQAVFNPATEGFVPPLSDMSLETSGMPQYTVGVDVGGEAQPVLAAADGQVFYSGASTDYGTLVIVRHQEGYETWYGGLTPEVRAGHTVLAGERIGTVKDATFKFLAFHDGEPLDPRPYMKKAGD